MICSMTAFGSAQTRLGSITLAMELRSVNSRFLDLHFRLPDELRQTEAPLRELLTGALARGKIEVRASFARDANDDVTRLDPASLHRIQEQLHVVRSVLPDTPAPRLTEILNWPGLRGSDPDSHTWTQTCLAAARQALTQMQAARQREGQRLADMMRTIASQITVIVDGVEAALPPLLADHRDRLAAKLRDALESAFPGGFAHISGAELSERLAQEGALFALRIDVAEELSRLRSHLTELDHLLAHDAPSAKRGGSVGKRLDFLFQEMNREANTLGSKAGSVDVTRAAIDLKLLIEQMREQAQNLE